MKGPDARYQHLSTAGQGHWRVAVSQSSLSLHLESQATAIPVRALGLMPEPMSLLVPTIPTSGLALSLGCGAIYSNRARPLFDALPGQDERSGWQLDHGVQSLRALREKGEEIA